MGILSNVLSRAGNPADVGGYVTEEIRELTGARCLLLVQCPSSAGNAHRVISVNPMRRREWAESADAQILYEAAHQLPDAQLIRSGEVSGIAAYLEQHEFGLSMYVPLHLGQLRIGGMLLLGLEDEHHVYSVLELINDLSTVIALVLHNAFLFEQQEQIIEARTKELRSANEQLHAELAERERIHQALTESEAKYRRIVDTATEGIWILGPDYLTTFVNAATAEMLGYGCEEMAGRPMTDFWFEEDRPHFPDKIERHGSGISGRYEHRFRHKDGRTVWAIVSTSPVFGGGRDFQGVLAMLTGITQRKQAEAEILQLNRDLEQRVAQRTAELHLARDAAEMANKAKSVFLANMSHELRTPLNAILGFSAMLRRDSGLDGSQREKLDIVNRSGEHLLTLIDDVLEITKIEAGRLQVAAAPFDLGGMVSDVASMMRLRAQEKGLRLEFDQSSSAFPRYIKGDEAHLRQVLINLAGNAVKFTRQGGVIIRLGVKQNGRERLTIEVEDTGPGIAPEDRKRLFRPFVQLAEGSAQKGTGLGLAISRQYCQLMGGAIDVESRVGKGSIFRVELPLERVGPADIGALLGAAQAGEVAGLAPGQPVYRILIAEDQEDNQNLLTHLMTTIGAEVKVAVNGQECVKIFQEWRPHLIWMDRRMPVMDGVQATAAIRRLPGGDEVKIVAVTASAFSEQRQEMLDAGMDDFVRKPYRFHEIYGCLATQLGVEYVYRPAEEEAAAAAELTPAKLAELPAAMRKELGDALESLDGDRITAAIGQVSEADGELAATLSCLAGNFDYTAILKALAAEAH